MNTVEITKMSLVEKLQAMDAIWDSLIHDNLDVKSPKERWLTLRYRKQVASMKRIGIEANFLPSYAATFEAPAIAY